MGEIKSVKVDNWGVFFLQKLQNFFNKTDYCDLTLQFRDNSQLKVHRLVLSACTDFFNVLEQTCELTDDALVMPLELQADVVVPIVNFMYTGTLEFELRMYNKLLKTAKEMNMTVLLKLLQAHKRTMEGTLINAQNSQAVATAKTKAKRLGPNSMPVSSTQAQQRRVLTEWPSTATARRVISTKTIPPSSVFKQVNTSMFMKTSPKMQRGPTRYESTDPNITAESYEPSFDAISYESKPLKEEPEDYEELPSTPVKSRTSPFEQLRKGYNNNKRPAVSTFTSPPAKKPNIEDVKEFSEQQRMRKQIAAEYGDDAEYDGVMDDDIHNDDDDDEPSAAPSSSLPVRQQPGQHQASIIIKQSPNEKPTIVVKDSSNSKMDHAKIISEVLRQYPHLVKGNKNIKLKIMPNAGGQAQKIIVKKESSDNAPPEIEPAKAAGIAQARQQLLQLASPKQQAVLKPKVANPGLTATKVEAQVKAVASAAAPNLPQQKRRIDSKTMHALIAQGAENTTGPWLCLRCGVNGRPISIPSYRGFRRHLINTHKETIDSALCEHCGWRSTSTLVLNHHLWVEHKIPTPLLVFPECEHCAKICIDQTDLDHHVRQVHPNAHKQQCIYCNKTFQQEMMLYSHMKTFHKKRAREDGVIDFSDEELGEFDEELKELAPKAATRPDKKIKILSDISLPSTILKLDDLSAAIEDEYTADGGPKFVNAEGNEMVLTAEQREEIMSQLEQDHDGGVVMVLNESAFPPGEGEVLDHDTKHEITEDEFDDNQIYNEFPRAEHTDCVENVSRADGDIKEEMRQEQEHQESEHDERADEDHMEWAENVISAHDAIEDKDDDEIDDDEQEVGDEKNTSATTDEQIEEIQVSSSKSASGTEEGEKNNSKKEEDISMKLKMLTGDWTDDEIEEEGEDPLLEKEKIAELITSSAPVKTADNQKSATDEQKITLNESYNKDKVENEPIADRAEVEDDLFQSSEREKGRIKTEEEIAQPPEEDSNKSEETILESQLSHSTIETKDEVSREEKRTRRCSSPKTDSIQSPNEEKTSLDDSNEKDKSLNDKETAIKVETDSFAASEEDTEEEASPPGTKPDTTTDKKKTISSTETPGDDSDKTADKVKTIMSEWAEDEDEV